MMHVYVSGADDLVDVLEDFLGRARRRVWIACYILSLPFVLVMLAEKAKKNVDVRVIVSDDPANAETVKFLRVNGVRVKIWFQRRGMLHTKMIIADDGFLIGSANLTHYGLNVNFEVMIVSHDKRVLRKLGKVFEQMWNMA